MTPLSTRFAPRVARPLLPALDSSLASPSKWTSTIRWTRVFAQGRQKLGLQPLAKVGEGVLVAGPLAVALAQTHRPSERSQPDSNSEGGDRRADGALNFLKPSLSKGLKGQCRWFVETKGSTPNRTFYPLLYIQSPNAPTHSESTSVRHRIRSSNRGQ